MNEFRTIGIDTAINLLGELFETPFVVSSDSESKPFLAKYKVSGQTESEYDRLSQFGTPILGSFWAIPSDLPYLVYDENDKLVSRTYSEFEFPVATLVDFSRQKYINKQNTIGGKGSVKEIMGLGDWEINIRGILVDDDSRIGQKTVKEQRYALDRLNEIAGAIKIRGNIFEERHISNIVIENSKFSAVQGSPGILQYEMQAYSDESFILSSV